MDVLSRSFDQISPPKYDSIRTGEGRVVPMGTIVSRKRKNGSVGHTAQVVIKRGGEIVYRKAKTFDRKQAAAIWLEGQEAALRKPGGLEAARKPLATLGDAIDRAMKDSVRKVGKTKAQVLRTLKSYPIADKACEDIESSDLVELAQSLGAKMQPQTVGNYISHLSSVFALGKVAWNMPLDPQVMADAKIALRRLGTTSKSQKRDRRPTIAEMDALMEHFHTQWLKRPDMVPMHKVCAYALFSTRRQEEIVTIKRADLDADGSRQLVRNMKHPGQKVGNDVWCDLTPEALAIALSMPESEDGRLFPYTVDAVGANFTRACKYLGIEDLHFHDLRHEGVSRLFEMGRTIPRVATVSGHRSWQSLQRYTHLRQTGDKWAGWKSLSIITGETNA
jgi:integrase